MSKYSDTDKRELAIQMMHFCETLFDEFTDYHQFRTSETLNEELFDEMLTELEDKTDDT